VDLSLFAPQIVVTATSSDAPPPLRRHPMWRDDETTESWNATVGMIVAARPRLVAAITAPST
jgi:hypothetical protein